MSQTSAAAVHEGAPYDTEYRVVWPDRTERVLASICEAIIGAAKTGQIGDGKIFVLPIEHAVRIRTGETDTDAL